MTTFQAVGLPLMGLLALITLVAIIRHAINGRAGTGWLLLWIAAAGAIALLSEKSVVSVVLLRKAKLLADSEVFLRGLAVIRRTVD